MRTSVLVDDEAAGRSPEVFFDGHPDALLVYQRVRSTVASLGPFEVRVTKAQVSFRRRRGFAYLWLPGTWLSKPAAEVVLSIATDHRIGSERFKQVVHPSERTWMHHLEVRSLEELDEEVVAWLADAWRNAW